ncbi:MAG TPA: glutathione S-transferase N-terminal domain-containing protein [Solirubrobacteraceae bacterium]|nr:glutathione S-transferase N-terminal domain-containing protein [Solirubrobacteraceae bacterium]
MSSSPIKLYVLPGSHPCAAVEAGMRLKSLDFKRIDWLPLTQLAAGPLLYGGRTVPGMRIGRERLVGSRAIMRRLDQLAPEPPLLPPPGSPTYAQVLEAERWGDEVFQSVPRRILDLCFVRRPEAMLSYAGDAKLPLPDGLQRPVTPLVARLMAMLNKGSEENVRADLTALPTQLARVDQWIAEGLLGQEQPNAADLQIGSTIRLLLTIGDLVPLIEPHPAAALVRYFPPMPGEIPVGVLPAAWLPAVPAGV